MDMKNQTLIEGDTGIDLRLNLSRQQLHTICNQKILFMDIVRFLTAPISNNSHFVKGKLSHNTIDYNTINNNHQACRWEQVFLPMGIGTRNYWLGYCMK